MIRTKIQLVVVCPYCDKDFLVTEKVDDKNKAKSVIEKMK